MRRVGLRLEVLALLALTVSFAPALALAVPAAPAPRSQPSLAATVAKEFSTALGMPVQIGSVRLALFSGTFVLRDVRVGPARAPLLRVAQVKAKPASLAGATRRLRRLEVSGWTVDLSSRQLLRPLPRVRGISAVGVDDLLALRGAITVREPGGGKLSARAVGVRGKQLSLRYVRGVLRPKGSLEITLGKLVLGALTATDVRLALSLSSRAIRIRSLTAKLQGGKLEAKGQWGLGRNKLGILRLVGTFKSPRWQGKGRLAGPVTKLTLSGALKSAGGNTPQLVPSQGTNPNAPRLRLDLRLGRRRLRGRLDHWRLR